jgi:hypothetical protein
MAGVDPFAKSEAVDPFTSRIEVRTVPQRDLRRERFGMAFPEYEATPIGAERAMHIYSPKQIQERVPSSSNDIADLTGNSDEHYASVANAKFFSDQFHVSVDDSVMQEKRIGRALYGNKNLSSYQINALIQTDIDNGTFNERAQLARWRQYGVDEETAKNLDDLYHSDWMDTARFYTGVVPRGIAQAFTGLVAGAGDLFGADTPMVDTFNEMQNEFTSDYLNDALIRGNYADYIAGQSSKTAGDVVGNLFLMGKSIKAANAWTGGKLSLAAKGKTWKELAGSTLKRSTFLSGLNFVKTEGSFDDKWRSAMLTMAYMNTPIISSMAPQHSTAFLSDFILNSGISGSYNPETKEFEFGGQYAQAWEDATEMAENMGRPQDREKIFIGMAMPILGADIAFSALTRSIRQNSSLPQMNDFVSAQRIIESRATASSSEMANALKAKYGDGWEFTMSEADRLRYNSVKTTENAIKNGKIDPDVLRIEEPPDKSRFEVKDGGVYYRDDNGALRKMDGDDSIIRMDVKPDDKAAEKEAKERNKLISNISSDTPVKFDFEYRRSIENIQNSLLVGANDKAIFQLKETADYVRDNPDAKLPPKLVKKLEKTPVQELSTEDLRTLSGEVDRLRQLGKTKYKLEQKRRKEALNAESEGIASNFKTPTKRAVKAKGEADVAGKEKRKPTLKYVEERPSRFFDRLDGKKGSFDGPAHERFVNRVNSDAAKELENVDARTKGFEKLASSLGVKLKDFGKTVKVAGQKFTLQQIMGIYAMSKNRLGYNAIVHGNLKDVKDADKVIEDINRMVETDPNMKMMADYILYDFASNSDRVFDAIGRNEGQIPNREEFYIPMERAGVEQKTSMEDVHNQVMERQAVIKNSPKDTFKIDREILPKEYQTPINLDLFNLWERHVGLQEHYINNIANVKDMRSIAQNKDLREQLKLSYGPAAGRYIDEYIDVVANPMAIYSQKDFDVLSRRVRKNIATAYLAGNVKTMIKQSPSLAFYLGETRPDYLLGSIAEFQGAWKTVDGVPRNSLIDFVAEKDPLVKHSHMQRELAELQLKDKNKYDQVMNKIGEAGFKGIVEVDKMMRSIGWYSVYKYNKEVKGYSEEKSIQEARNATLRTQPTARAADLPPIYRTNEGLNWLLMFSNQLNQIWNMTTKDIPRRALGGQKGKAAMQTAGLATAAMMMWSINNGKPLPESGEDIGDAFSEQFVASMPLVGNMIMQGMKGYSSSNPVSEMFERGGKMYVKLKNGEEIEQKEYYDMFFRGVAPVAGVPTVAIDRGKKFLETGDLGELTGVKEKD